MHTCTAVWAYGATYLVTNRWKVGPASCVLHPTVCHQPAECVTYMYQPCVMSLYPCCKGRMWTLDPCCETLVIITHRHVLSSSHTHTFCHHHSQTRSVIITHTHVLSSSHTHMFCHHHSHTRSVIVTHNAYHNLHVHHVYTCTYMHVNTYWAPPSGSQGKVYGYLYALACTNNTLMETKQDIISNKQHILEQKDDSPNKQEICQKIRHFFEWASHFVQQTRQLVEQTTHFSKCLPANFLRNCFFANLGSKLSRLHTLQENMHVRVYVCMYVCMCMKMYIRRVFGASVHFYFHLHKIMVFTFKHSWFLHTILTQVYT
jgi:hypothetical protein